MRTGLALAAIALTLCACSPAPSGAVAGQGAPVASVASEPQGRFAIVQTSLGEPVTVLLDTVSGRTWKLVQSENGPAWVQIYRPPPDQNSN